MNRSLTAEERSEKIEDARRAERARSLMLLRDLEAMGRAPGHHAKACKMAAAELRRLTRGADGDTQDYISVYTSHNVALPHDALMAGVEVLVNCGASDFSLEDYADAVAATLSALAPPMNAEDVPAAGS